jgi:predicted RND superfamily exporter protein
VFSDLPSLRLFGWLSAFAMIAALVGDLLILPATVMFLRKRMPWGKRRRTMPKPAE